MTEVGQEHSEPAPLTSSRCPTHPQRYTGGASKWHSVLVCGFLEFRLLFRRRILLMLGFPLLERLAVDDLAALVLAHRYSLRVGRLLHPVGQAVAAEAGEI